MENLHIDKNMLATLFSKYGQIKEISIFSQKVLVKAFVEFVESAQADECIKRLNNTKLNIGWINIYYSAKEQVNLQIARHKKPRSKPNHIQSSTSLNPEEMFHANEF